MNINIMIPTVWTIITSVLHNIRITTERVTSQPDKALLFHTEVYFNFYGEILSSEL